MESGEKLPIMKTDKIIEDIISTVDHFRTGYYGIPGGPGCRNTKVHLVFRGKPLCGCKLSKEMEFQWCANFVHLPYVECENCKRLFRILREKIEKLV